VTQDRDKPGETRPGRPAAGSGGRRTGAAKPAARSGDRAEPCQARMLEQWQRESTMLDVYLRSGTRLRGKLAGYDAFMIGLQSEDGLQAVYKQVILTVVPVTSRPGEREGAKRPVITVKRRITG
jgi:RNA chaperone Hfq